MKDFESEHSILEFSNLLLNDLIPEIIGKKTYKTNTKISIYRVKEAFRKTRVLSITLI